MALTPAQAAEVRDDRGITIHMSKPPQRIVTLLPSLTEFVCALQACDKLVGTDRFSNYPAQVQALPKAGGLEDASIERIVALKPDLVLAGTSARVIERLEAMGITVVALEPKNMADTHRVLFAVAALLQASGLSGAGSTTGANDANARADALWQTIQHQIDAATARVPPAWRGKRAYFEVDASPYAAGPVSFMGETMQRLGLGNIVPPELGPFPKLNPEFIVRAQPDLIIGGTADVATMGARPGWDTLHALRDHRVCAFQPAQSDVLVRPGPRMGEAAGLLADCVMKLKAPQ